MMEVKWGAGKQFVLLTDYGGLPSELRLQFALPIECVSIDRPRSKQPLAQDTIW